MKNYLFVALLSLLLLGCQYPSNTIGLQIEKSKSDFSTLIGSVDALNNKYPTVLDTLKFNATDGEITCSGSSSNGLVKGNTASHNFPITCSDGRNGTLRLEMTLKQGQSIFLLDSTGIGVGTLSDGSKVKVLVGELNGTIGW